MMKMRSLQCLSLLFLASGAFAAAPRRPLSVPFSKNYNPTWAFDHIKYYNGGNDITLMLDKYTGTGFQSKGSYLFGHFSMDTKMVPGDSAGTVTTFYETFEFLNILQVHDFPKVMGVLTHLDEFKDVQSVYQAQVGQGGYGKVYRGVLSDGTVVAVKRAQEGPLQGDKEFLNEIELLSRVHHRNLVSLIGYCNEEGEQMLVYEFMPNGTLRDHLFAKSKAPLSFSMRLQIATDSAKGILYLYTEGDPPIFHRDVKSSNILVGPRFSGKVADFGLSRLAPVADPEGITPGHVSTVVKGTPGYLDLEYFLTHKLTDKSDVYSLGVNFLK